MSEQVSLAPSVARTADWDVPFTVGRGIACHLVIDITGYTPGSLTVTIQGVDPVSGKKYTILASAALAAAATTVLRVGPGLTAASNTVANDFLPKEININFNHADATAITYSAGLQIIY